MTDFTLKINTKINTVTVALKKKKYLHMKTLSLKIDDSIFGETEKIISRISIPRNRYINQAIEYYNSVQKRQILEKRLKAESELVKKESMNILSDFEYID